MPKFQMTIDTEYPVLFLCDTSAGPSYPDVSGKTFATASVDCVAFYSLSYVDGASVVTVTDEACDLGGKEMFAGTI